MTQRRDFMSDHISELRMEKFYTRTLEVPELTRVAGHLEACSTCRHAYQEVFQRGRDGAPFAFDLSPERWLEGEHISYEQLAPYVEDRVDATERELFDIHLMSCATCREDLRCFSEYRRQIEPELLVRYAPRMRSSWGEKLSRFREQAKVGQRPAYAAAIVMAVIAGFIILTVAFQGLRGTSDNAARQAQSNRTVAAPPTVVSNTAPSSLPTPSAGDINRGSVADLPTKLTASPGSTRPVVRQPRTVRAASALTSVPMQLRAARVSFEDGGREIALNNSGGLTGLDNLPPATEQAVKDVLLARAIYRPQILAELASAGGPVRGAAGNEPRLKLISPEQAVLVEDRPTFRWESLEQATGYRVQVVDAHNREVTRSPELPATAGEWQPSLPLPRGVVYTWIVIAEVQGGEVMSPAATEPERRFKVLGAEHLTELNHLKEQANSHLVRGVWYARAGMLDAAEQEFQALVGDNPRSPLARKLLRTVQSWR